MCDLTHDKIASLTCLAYNQPAVNKHKGSEYVVHYFSGKVLIIFKGQHDWNFPAMFTRVVSTPSIDSDLGLLHGKCRSRAMAVWSEILDVVMTFPKVVLAGHGLGGSEATIIAGWLNRAGGKEIELVTFGNPHVGGKKLKENLKGVKCTRYINGNDWVSKMGIPVLTDHVCPSTKLEGDGHFIGDHHMIRYESSIFSKMRV